MNKVSHNTITTGNMVDNVAATEHNVAATEHNNAVTEHNDTVTKHTVAKDPVASLTVSSPKKILTSAKPALAKTSKAEGLPSLRERSSDSLTLSSSVSDSEVTSSEGASCNGAPTNNSKNTAKVSAGKKSRKQSKKAKKCQKKSQPPPSKEKSEKSLKRRAHVIQRIRNDSWNTSSDEENSLAPPTESSSTEMVFPEVAEATGEVVDVRIVQADLQKRILSKKPPAHFETPATEPIYHEVRLGEY